eukprot:912285-Prorocentrum_minimum.AAC.1
MTQMSSINPNSATPYRADPNRVPHEHLVAVVDSPSSSEKHSLEEYASEIDKFKNEIKEIENTSLDAVRTGLYLVLMGNFKKILVESASELVARLIDQVRASRSIGPSREYTRASRVRLVRRENIPARPASDWPVVRIYPRALPLSRLVVAPDRLSLQKPRLPREPQQLKHHPLLDPLLDPLQVRDQKQQSNQEISEKYSTMSTEVMRVPANGEEVLLLKKYIADCRVDHEQLMEQIAFNKSREVGLHMAIT